MALTFSAASGNTVSITANSYINNLNPYTEIFWVYPTSLASLGAISGKGIAGQNHQFTLRTTGDLDYFKNRATTNTSFRSTGLGITANNWYFIALTFDTSASPVVHMYVGTPTAVITEVTYTINTDGSGAIVDDSGGNLQIGNLHGLGNSFKGEIAFTGFWNRVLTLAEIKDQQFFPHITNGCVLFSRFNNSTVGSQLDQSGLGNKGTVTGATVSTVAEPTGVMFNNDPGVSNNYQTIKVGNGMSASEKIK